MSTQTLKAAREGLCSNNIKSIFNGFILSRKRNSTSVGAKTFNTGKKSRLQLLARECVNSSSTPYEQISNDDVFKVFENMKSRCRCKGGNAKAGGCFLMGGDVDPTAAVNTVKAKHALLGRHDGLMFQTHLINLFRSTVDWDASNEDRLCHDFNVECDDKKVKLCRNVFALLHGITPTKLSKVAKWVRVDTGAFTFLFLIGIIRVVTLDIPISTDHTTYTESTLPDFSHDDFEEIVHENLMGGDVIPGKKYLYYHFIADDGNCHIILQILSGSHVVSHPRVSLARLLFSG
jgi:hypothetical protein